MTIAIVGCGSTGSAIAEQLVRRNKVDKIRLADLDLDKTNKVLKNLRKLNEQINYSSNKLNATKSEDIEKILENVEVVINSASPLCNIPIMEACLKSRTNYIDLASSPFKKSNTASTSFDDQLGLHKDFVNKNLLAVTNAGFSPGFTDLLSKYVIDKNSLDSVDYIRIYLGEKIEADKFVVSWSPYIFLKESILPPTVYKKGKIITVNSEQAYRTVDFPLPLGKMKLRIFNGHPELRTIPKYIDIPIDYIEVGGGYILNNMEFSDVIVESLRKKVRKSTLFEGEIFEILSSSFENPDDFFKNYKEGLIKNEVSVCIFKIRGKRNGKDFEHSVKIKHDLERVSSFFSSGSVSSFMVSFVPTIIAEKIVSGSISEKGVVAPAKLDSMKEIIEECEDAGLFRNQI